jgi:hypothetical protein
MITKNRLLLCALVLAAPVWLVLWAADTVPPRSAGRVLVLENERTLEGDIERHGDQYRIRRAVGETWVPSDKVLRLCATRAEAYLYLRERANLSDPDERLRLAQWCQLNGLREQALAEVTAAVELRPSNPETCRLLRSLQRAVANPVSPVHAPSKETAAAPAPLPPVDLNADSISMFVTRVQPVLMNACASCHASGRTPAFKLTRAFEGGTANRKTVQQNVATVLAQVNVERPEVSPLLVKAVSIHGDMVQPPLKGRQAPAFRVLEDWVQGTLANNPQLAQRTSATVPLLPAEARGTEAVPGKVSEPVAEAPPPKASVPETPPAAPADAFDPALFNRQFKPQQSNSQNR